MSNTATAVVNQFTPNPRREELKALSNELKPFAYEAETTINAVLVAHYADFTGENAETFKTLEAWNAEGYQVKKGEQSFMIWSKPEKKTLNKSEGLQGQEAEVSTLYRTVHLFNIGQVIKQTKKQTNNNKATQPKESAKPKLSKNSKNRA